MAISKNNPLKRQKAKEIMYKGKVVIPVALYNSGRKVMIAGDENGEPVFNDRGETILFSTIAGIN